MISTDTGLLSNTTRDLIAIVGLALAGFQTAIALFSSDHVSLRRLLSLIPPRIEENASQSDFCRKCGSNDLSYDHYCNNCGLNLRPFREKARAVLEDSFFRWFVLTESAHFVANIFMRSHLNFPLEALEGVTSVFTWMFVGAEAFTFMIFMIVIPDEIGSRFGKHDTPEEDRRIMQWAFRNALIFSFIGLFGILLSNTFSNDTVWLLRSLIFQLIGPWFVIAVVAGLLNLVSVGFLLNSGWRGIKSYVAKL